MFCTLDDGFSTLSLLPSSCTVIPEKRELPELGCPRNKIFGSNRNKPKQDLFRLCFGLFRETKNKKIRFVSVCFGVSNLYRNNWNIQNCFERNRNNPKFSEKYQNMLSIKHRNSLFRFRTVTTETNALFWIVSKLVSVHFRLFRIGTPFRRTP